MSHETSDHKSQRICVCGCPESQHPRGEVCETADCACLRFKQPSPVDEGWQPIDTAPKDGTPILVFGPYEVAGRVNVVKWYCNSWAVTTDEYGWERVSYATHWQPLPSPPATETP